MALKNSRYKVVVNHEEQYSIIPLDQDISRGWKEVGTVGSQTECIKFIEEVWTDMKSSDRDQILRRIGG